MSIVRSLSGFITGTLDTATDTINTVGKGLDIANHFVGENHKRITKTTTVAAQLAVARFNEDVAKELEADANLKRQFETVVAEW